MRLRKLTEERNRFGSIWWGGYSTFLIGALTGTWLMQSATDVTFRVLWKVDRRWTGGGPTLLRTWTRAGNSLLVSGRPRKDISDVFVFAGNFTLVEDWIVANLIAVERNFSGVLLSIYGNRKRFDRPHASQVLTAWTFGYHLEQLRSIDSRWMHFLRLNF